MMFTRNAQLTMVALGMLLLPQLATAEGYPDGAITMQLKDPHNVTTKPRDIQRGRPMFETVFQAQQKRIRRQRAKRLDREENTRTGSKKITTDCETCGNRG